MRFVRLLAWGVVMAAVVVAALGGAGYWLYRDAQAPGPLTGARALVIPPHTGIDGIAELLAEQEVIRHKLVFELVARLSGRGTALKAGEFEFPAAASTLQALDIIASGRSVRHRLTIPEGLTSAEIVALVREAPALDGDPGPLPAEGELFPDTYLYSHGEAREELIERMRHSMAHVVAELWSKRRPNLLLTSQREAVILASIIEKETAREEERAHIAGVFVNRLRLGMPLQADPTVLFALRADGGGNSEHPLSHADLAVDSPYNTYVVKGLPPGPIDNPGRSSLRAAMRPEPTEDLYFVADGNGGHVFAKTLAEQDRNIAQYRRGPAADAQAQPESVAAVATSAPAPPPLKPHPPGPVRQAARHCGDSLHPCLR